MRGRDLRRGRVGPALSRWSGESQSTVVFDKHIRDYVTKGLGPPGTWLSKPELPTSEEILALDDEKDINLRVNQLEGAWSSKEDYLKTHYGLLREDAVSPLRDAVAVFRDNPKMSDSPECCVYEKVHIIALTFAQSGVAFRVRFSTFRAGKKIVWEYSKRLMTGNLVALSPASDAFHGKCIVATVAARPLDGLKLSPPEIDLFFANPEEAEFDYQQEWVMVEGRTGYFEAARHTLSSLQKLSNERFPLSEHICGLDPKISTPKYLLECPMINISTVMAEEKKSPMIHVEKQWPSNPNTLDLSQWKAFQRIITQSLSIVQGPPGTGKTHISVVAIRTMLENSKPGDPPIIIAAQTNHALDQLLHHISKFEPNYVRLGGRSTNLDIRMRTVFELRKKNNTPMPIGGSLGTAYRELYEIKNRMLELLFPFRAEQSHIPLQPSLFLQMGLISAAQHDSILKGAAGWVCSGDQADPMSIWLGDGLTKFELLYKPESFGFIEEDLDLEYEQLKEFEAEHGIDDDDYETLKGQTIELKEVYMARNHRIHSDKSVVDNYLTNEDLWEIPSTARVATYSWLQRRAKEIVREKFRFMLDRYNSACRNIKIGKWERDLIITRDSRVVGMTTTGLSKYRALVSGLQPKVILVEEAAEVLEAPVTVACVESLQQLILVGDHQQLRGSCSVPELEGYPFYLDISMFERLVRNSMPFERLTSQRRMAPEIRQILLPIYSDLHDHPSVLARPGVPGMGDVNSYFFTHAWQESHDSLASKYNLKEAKMVAGFYIYLHKNGVPVQDITILTFYNGQRKKILKLLKENPILQGQYTKVVTVDSYQGEENEIVLLSLVRSNDYNNIGFLAAENRVCVALSRAKRGFYIFGDAESLSISSGLWWKVARIMGMEPRRLGYLLPLTCTKHQNRAIISNEEEWSNNDGGCSQKCGENLSCGHNCPLLCHALPHSRLQCQSKCTRTLPCGHKCIELCFRDCRCMCTLSSKATVPDSQEAHLITPQIEVPVPVTNAEDRALLAKRYQQYATGGGAQEEDARLAKEAERLALQEQLRKMDEEASIALFGEENVTEPVSKDVEERSEVVSTGEGGARMRFTQLYSNPVPPSNDRATAPSLLD